MISGLSIPPRSGPSRRSPARPTGRMPPPRPARRCGRGCRGDFRGGARPTGARARSSSRRYPPCRLPPPVIRIRLPKRAVIAVAPALPRRCPSVPGPGMSASGSPRRASASIAARLPRRRARNTAPAASSAAAPVPASRNASAASSCTIGASAATAEPPSRNPAPAAATPAGRTTARPTVPASSANAINGARPACACVAEITGPQTAIPAARTVSRPVARPIAPAASASAARPTVRSASNAARLPPPRDGAAVRTASRSPPGATGTPPDAAARPGGSTLHTTPLLFLLWHGWDVGWRCESECPGRFVGGGSGISNRQ